MTFREDAEKFDAATDRLIHEFAKATGLLWIVEHLNAWLIKHNLFNRD